LTGHNTVKATGEDITKTDKMKNTLFIFAMLFGAALAEDAKSIQASEEGRLFVGLPTIITLIQLGAQIIILLALINFVTSLKGSIDFDNLFGKGGDAGYADYGYDSGYAAPDLGYAPAPAATAGGHGSSYSSYRRAGHAVEKRSAPLQRLQDKVYSAIEKLY